MGEEGDGSAPLSHSTFHESHHPADTNFSSSLASGTMFFFFQKSVMKPPSSLLAVQLPCSVLLPGLPDGAGIGDQEETLKKALGPHCWVYRAKRGVREKGSWAEAGLAWGLPWAWVGELCRRFQEV